MGNRALLFFCGAMLLLGCGHVDESTGLDEQGETGVVEDELLKCGWTCESTYHATAYSCNATCGSCPTANNRVNCELNSGTFTTCGSGCPSGWHPIAYSTNPFCYIYYTETGKNESTCEPNTSSGFYTCGLGCPSGYKGLFFSTNPNCYWYASEWGNNQTYCVPY